MKKKIGLGIVAAIFVIGVAVFAADNRHFNDLQKDIRTVVKGILSPQQISTLMDFRRDHDEKFHWKTDARPDLYKTWKELDLSGEQQKQLLKISGDLVDKTHPSLMILIETANELKQKVIEGNPHHPSIKQLSAQIGTKLGEIFWELTLMRSQIGSILTPEQIRIMEQHHTKHDLRMNSAIHALPDMAEDFAALWSELKLTPKQMDALQAVFRLIARDRHDHPKNTLDEWRADLAKILTPEQLAVADRFHEKQVATGGAYSPKMVEERECFHEELGLTGEQKIKLVQIVLDRRAQIVPSIQEIMNAAGGLREQVHTDVPDRSALMAASSKLGDAIGRAAGVGAEFVSDAREVLTTEQMDLVKTHINNHFNQHLEHARIIPVKFHELIDFLTELSLTPEQKDQVVKLIAEKHEVRKVKHHGMKSIF